MELFNSFFSSRSILTQHSWGGCALGGVPVKNDRLTELGKLAFTNLGPWFGPVNAEFLWSKKHNDFVFIEVNPRYWGYSSLVVAAGLNFPDMCVSLALGEDVTPNFNYRTDIITLPSRQQIAYKKSDLLGPLPPSYLSI